MRTLALIAACFMAHTALADWTPPADPDPKKIRDEAREDERAGRYEDALAKRVWYHENSRNYAGLGGVRLSFALMESMDLGKEYPPALDKLREVRDEAEKAVNAGKDVWQSFQDYASINEYLGE